jgi:hypothetical protein
MWIRFYKPLILSLAIGIAFQIAIICLCGRSTVRFEYFYILSLILIIIGILITYQSCARDRQCRNQTRLVVFAIPPVALYLGLTGFLFFNTNIYLREIFLGLSGIAFFIIFSEIFSDLTHKAHDLVKFLIIFLLFDSILELVHYFRLPLYFIPVLVLMSSFILMHHMFWRLSAIRKKHSLMSLGIAGFLAIFAWSASHFWPLASYFILAIMLMSLYYVFWGLMHHYLEHHLTRNIALDYILIGAFVFLMALGLLLLGR